MIRLPFHNIRYNFVGVAVICIAAVVVILSVVVIITVVVVVVVVVVDQVC